MLGVMFDVCMEKSWTYGNCPSWVFMGRAVNGRRAGRSHLWFGRVLWSGSHQAFERPRANQSGTVSMRPGYPLLALGAS